MRNTKLNFMLKATLLGVIGFTLGFLETPLLIFPGFLKIDISEITTVISGFALGPIYAVLSALIKNLLWLFRSSTGGVGEIANFVIGLSFALPAAILYRRNKTKQNAIIGLSLGTVCMVIVGVLMNYFVLLPFYANVMKFPLEAIIGMAQAINPRVNSLVDFLIWVVAPFNLIKALVISLITLLIYKKLSPLLHK